MFYDTSLTILYPVTIAIILAMAGLGGVFWYHVARIRNTQSDAELGTPFTGAALGLLALLLGFSYSLALSRYDARRGWVLEEANAISSTANFALMLPIQAQRPFLNLLRRYAIVRRDLNIPFDPEKMAHDVALSVAIQTMLWQQATQLSKDISPSNMIEVFALNRFIASLNEMNNIHERRLTALRYRVPTAVTVVLVGVAMLVIAATGYHAGVTGARRHGSVVLMSVLVAIVIMMIIDLDRPTRGLIQVPTQALQDAIDGIPP